ncbi:glycosyltransferase family 9 protein [Prosthecobacter sp.]|uniref:glycosyltransferase family 9 protein n=1 Tax=Prosthecobacter sp. TaxID=1965333 RepID=UPI00378465CD
MPWLSPALKVLAWLCRRPWEALSVVRTLRRAKRSAHQRGGRVRVLARAGGLGDVLWAAAAADLAAKHSPQDVLLFLTQPAMLEAVRLASPDIAVIAPHLPNPHMQSLLRRFCEVVEMEYEPHDTAGTHMVHTYLRQLGCPQEMQHPAWHFERVPLFRAAQPFACIYTGPSWPVREAPMAVWSAVIPRLKSELGLCVLHVLPHPSPAQTIPGCDELVIGAPLASLCNLFDQSALVLTIDSIMLHLAAGTRAPLVAIFGPTLASCRMFETPRQRALSAQVDCAGCHHRTPRLHWETGCPYDIACMQQISADAIMAAASQVLALPPR